MREIKLDIATFLTIRNMVQEYESESGLTSDALAYYMQEIGPTIKHKYDRLKRHDEYTKINKHAD